MNDSPHRQTKKPLPALLAAALAPGGLFGTIHCAAQTVTPPPAPAISTPGAGNILLLPVLGVLFCYAGRRGGLRNKKSEGR
jgi:hypothetical protein